MSRLIRLIFLGGVFTFGANAVSSPRSSLDSSTEYDWKFAKAESGVIVNTAAVPGSKFKIFQAVTTLNTTMASVLGVLNDPCACSKWLHQCRHSEILEYTSFNERIIYQVIDLPLVSDRDLVVLATTSYQADTRSFFIALESKPDQHPSTKSNVRIKLSHGSYTLIPDAEGQIKVIWEYFADPAGWLPKWIVNLSLLDTPIKSLEKLKKLVTDEKYQSLQIDYDSHGIPVALIDSRTGMPVTGVEIAQQSCAVVDSDVVSSSSEPVSARLAGDQHIGSQKVAEKPARDDR